MKVVDDDDFDEEVGNDDEQFNKAENKSCHWGQHAQLYHSQIMDTQKC